MKNLEKIKEDKSVSDKDLLEEDDLEMTNKNIKKNSPFFLPVIFFALAIALHGLYSLIFEVQDLIRSAFAVYLARLFATVSAFVILLIAQTDSGKLNSEKLLHSLFLILTLSFGFVAYKLPDSFLMNAYLAAITILVMSFFIGWHSKNQLTVVIEFIVTFSTVFAIRQKNIFVQTMNPFEIINLGVLPVLSMISNYHVFKLRTKRENEIKNSNLEQVGEELKTDNESENQLPEDSVQAIDRNIEEKLKEQIKKNAEFKDFLENLPDPVFKLNNDGKIIYANKAFLKIAKVLHPEEIYDKKSLEDFVVDKEEFAIFQKLLNKQGIIKNYHLTFASGETEIKMRINSRLLTDKNNKPICIEGNLQDISSLLKKEEGLKEELEKLQREKNIAHTEKNRAEKTSDVKTQFLANMSHEIRTPMNSVLGFLTLIENEMYENKDELKEFANNARLSAESLLDIINNILDISKIEAGKMELDEKGFNLREEIDKVISIILPTIKEKGLKIKFDYSQDLPSIVYGDNTRYRQILLNLVSNSIKFTKEGGIKIKVDLHNNKIRTTVADTGTGIPKEYIPNLFKPYTQVKDKGNIHRPKGTGLGLTIVKEFVNLMGGEIEVKSKVNEGSVFAFTVSFKFEEDAIHYEEFNFEKDESDLKLNNEIKLNDEIKKTDSKVAEQNLKPDDLTVDASKIPAVKLFDDKNINILSSENLIDDTTESISEVTSEVQADLEIPRLTPNQKNKKRLLLVEDNPISQNVELRILREVGYAVDPVSNGIDAIEAVKTGKFDLVLMDVEMAEMDGLTATKEIRGLDSEIRDIPIIAVTANSSMKDREKCLAAGMNDYISKPININFLKMTIDQWLNIERYS